MADPVYWHALAVLFVFAGLLNLARGLRSQDARRSVRITLGLSCFAWAAATVLLRFAGPAPGYLFVALGAALMLYAAYQSARSAGKT